MCFLFFGWTSSALWSQASYYDCDHVCLSNRGSQTWRYWGSRSNMFTKTSFFQLSLRSFYSKPSWTHSPDFVLHLWVRCLSDSNTRTNQVQIWIWTSHVFWMQKHRVRQPPSEAALDSTHRKHDLMKTHHLGSDVCLSQTLWTAVCREPLGQHNISLSYLTLIFFFFYYKDTESPDPVEISLMSSHE